MVQDVIDELNHRKLLRLHHLLLLLNERVERLDLAECRRVVNHSIIKTMATRCKKLVKLNLSFCKQFKGDALMELIKSLPNIVSLNLKGTNCNDQVMVAIGSHSHHLRELNVAQCPISDSGLMSLCVSFDPQKPKCPQLQSLDVTDTAVGFLGVKNALENLPLLRSFVFNGAGLCEIFEKMHGRNFESTNVIPETEQYRLTYLKVANVFGGAYLSARNVEITTRYCPHLQEISLLDSHYDVNEIALPLLNLKHLRTLHLKGNNNTLSTFEGVLPLLQTFGDQLRDLMLNELSTIDIPTIGWMCPNLTKFGCGTHVQSFMDFNPHLPDCLYSLGTRKSVHKPFQKLQTLELTLLNSDNNLSAQSMMALLEHSHWLNQVTAYGLRCLTDDTFADIMQKNKLNHIEVIEFNGCNEITASSIWELLLGQNKLRRLHLHECQEITRQDFDSFKKHIKKNKFILDIEWT